MLHLNSDTILNTKDITCVRGVGNVLVSGSSTVVVVCVCVCVCVYVCVCVCLCVCVWLSDSGNLLDEKFHPVRHLLEKHRHTNFQDLKTGLRNLQMELDFSNQAPVHFMLDNLDAFLQGYDTLSDILLAVVRAMSVPG